MVRNSNDTVEAGMIFFACMIVFASVIVGYLFLTKLLDEENKKIEYKHEQSRKNAEISEELLAKELNTEKKKFILSDRGGNVLDNSYSSHWVDKDLSGNVKTDDGEYIVYFDTEQIKKEDVEMYKPVKIKKIVKEG
ncbi:hypothetical protein AT268_30585 [Bacillus cereus]|uniref:Uncharacterized protein n=1 Tax=Bacillus cereus TaxID=1396 RepID=A0A9X0SP75_BACCE|nr:MULTISPECIES: hypothetical protein [Bacillus cereus group]KXY50897.1 hypothetical protein AT268_30585 [Bacillus cereus]PEZ75059.1 hypothetical protein CN410_13110 [Bacillus anthracis]PFA29249.1 hypothetical protein CN384_05765 [Bacillus thuringiensis]PGW06745.1 hypothetical protein COD97_27380 [Bacillus cereus]